jgi:hypothetical protein
VSGAVNSPSHYHKASGVEVIVAIEAWGLGFCLGNVIKYVARAGRKDSGTRIEDLHKARWYLHRELEALEREERERAERGEPVVVDGCLDLCPAGEGDEE